MKVRKDSCFLHKYAKVFAFGNYKKQYLFEKRHFLDKGSFFFLRIGLDELGFSEKKFFEKI